MLTRKIQLYPSKLEVIQYQKRFQELYDQMNKVNEKSGKILEENHSKAQVISLLKLKEKVFEDLKTMYQQLKQKEIDKFKVTINNVTQGLVPSLTNSSNKFFSLILFDIQLLKCYKRVRLFALQLHKCAIYSTN